MQTGTLKHNSTSQLHPPFLMELQHAIMPVLYEKKQNKEKASSAIFLFLHINSCMFMCSRTPAHNVDSTAGICKSYHIVSFSIHVL